jgi:hypothetical protein
LNPIFLLLYIFVLWCWMQHICNCYFLLTNCFLFQHKVTLFSQLIVFDMKSILFYVIIATPPSLHFHLYGIYFSQPLTFSHFISLLMKWLCCSWHTTVHYIF